MADVAEPSQVTAAAAAVGEVVLGPCDVLVANAGTYRKTSGRDFDAERAGPGRADESPGHPARDRRAAAGMVRRERGHLAAVSSLAGLLGLPGAVAYFASKQAVVTLMQSLRLDLARLGIRVTVVCPGYVDTGMITEQERATVRDLMSADDAALRIAWAIDAGAGGILVPLVDGPGGATGPLAAAGPVHADRRPLPKRKRPNCYAGAPRFSRRPTMPTMISRMHSSRRSLR